VAISVPRSKPSSASHRRVLPVEKENGEIVPDRENPTGSRAAVIIAVLLGWKHAEEQQWRSGFGET